MAAGNGVVGSEFGELAAGLAIGRCGLAHDLPEPDCPAKVALLFMQPGQATSQGYVFGCYLAGLLQQPNGQAWKSKALRGLGHLDLRADIVDVAGQNLFTVFEHAPMLASPPRGLESSFAHQSGQPTEGTA